MALSDEGVRLVSKIALIAGCILVTAFFRTLVGRGRKRESVMLLGTLGGITLGVLIGPATSRLAGSDVSSLTAVAGIFVGWTIAYSLIRRMPRQAP